MNSKDYRNIREAYFNVYEQEEVLDEITGGKGHPGYKAGSRDLGPMQSGHPADSSKRTMKGGTMSMRHGDHLGDLDDNDDDDDDGLEAGLKDSAKKSRENVRKPLRNMVKTAAKRLNKESYDQQLDEISQKTATRAFAQRATNEFETDQTSKKSDATKSRIEKKFGKKAGAHAERAAHANIFGRKSSSMPKESYDLYDIILSHLLDEGYAETQEAAERIMVNMSEEWRESIVETRMDPRGRPASGPMNVYANPKGKPSQAHLDAVKSYEDEQRKKTPEQRKKELDDYRERQMNNK